MTANGYTAIAAPPTAAIEPVSQELLDKFYYGHRLAVSYDKTGQEIYTYQPLKQEDFLDPQEGDHFVQGTLHEQDVDDVKSIFRYIHTGNPRTTVYSDLKIDWGIPDLSKPAPDVTVIPDVVDPEKPRGSFVVPEEETRPIFVLEMVSPRYVKPDYEAKVDIYERAGVEEYIIIDSGLRPWRNEIAYTVKGYRMFEGCYVPIQPDERGWIYSVINHVWIGVTADQDHFFVIDAETNEEILSDEKRAALAEAWAKAETVARTQAEEQAKAAQERVTIEALARTQAEERVKAEASARSQAEEQTKAAQERAAAEVLARTQAEEQAKAAEERATAAEQKQQALEAELALLRAQLAQGRA